MASRPAPSPSAGQHVRSQSLKDSKADLDAFVSGQLDQLHALRAGKRAELLEGAGPLGHDPSQQDSRALLE